MKSTRDQSVVLLGGAGQLARELAPAFGKRGWTVHAVSHVDCDITDGPAVQQLFERLRPQLAVNCAAFTHVDRAESEPKRAFAINATGAGNVARAAALLDVGLVHISSDYVFDGAKGQPYSESDRTAPMGVYARSKHAGEQEVRAAGARCHVVRTGELYGDGGQNFFHAILGRARKGLPLRVIDDQVVTPTWTRELAEQLLLIVERAPVGLYHATAAGETNWFEAARAALELAHLEVPIAPVSTADYGSPTPRPLYSVLAHDALNRLGLYQMRPWREALAQWLSHDNVAA